jgi:hypothetical protein
MSARAFEALAKWALPLGVAASAAQYSMYNGEILAAYQLELITIQM